MTLWLLVLLREFQTMWNDVDIDHTVASLHCNIHGLPARVELLSLHGCSASDIPGQTEWELNTHYCVMELPRTALAGLCAVVDYHQLQCYKQHMPVRAPQMVPCYSSALYYSCTIRRDYFSVYHGLILMLFITWILLYWDACQWMSPNDTSAVQ